MVDTDEAEAGAAVSPDRISRVRIRPYDPTPKYAEPYMSKELPLMEVAQEELDSQPPPFKAMRVHNCEIDHDSVVHQMNPSEEARHMQRAYYLANVTMIDEKVGLIMDAA